MAIYFSQRGFKISSSQVANRFSCDKQYFSDINYNRQGLKVKFCVKCGNCSHFKILKTRGARLTRSVDCVTLDLGVTKA